MNCKSKERWIHLMSVSRCGQICDITFTRYYLILDSKIFFSHSLSKKLGWFLVLLEFCQSVRSVIALFYREFAGQYQQKLFLDANSLWQGQGLHLKHLHQLNKFDHYDNGVSSRFSTVATRNDYKSTWNSLIHSRTILKVFSWTTPREDAKHSHKYSSCTWIVGVKGVFWLELDLNKHHQPGYQLINDKLYTQKPQTWMTDVEVCEYYQVFYHQAFYIPKIS